MSQDIQNMFDAIAPRYDCLNHLLSFRMDRRWRVEGVRYLAELPRVLDLCAGTLDLSIELVRQSPKTQIMAVDFSQEMLDHGQAKLGDEQSEKIHTQWADVMKLPFADNSFDGAMVAYGFRNVDDNEQALQEVARVVQPGGRFVILEFFRPARWWERLFAATYARTIIPLIGGLISGNRQAYEHLRNSIDGFHTITDYTALMERCGFEQVIAKRQWGPSTLITGVVS